MTAMTAAEAHTVLRDFQRWRLRRYKPGDRVSVDVGGRPCCDRVTDVDGGFVKTEQHSWVNIDDTMPPRRETVTEAIETAIAALAGVTAKPPIPGPESDPKTEQPATGQPTATPDTAAGKPATAKRKPLNPATADEDDWTERLAYPPTKKPDRQNRQPEPVVDWVSPDELIVRVAVVFQVRPGEMRVTTGKQSDPLARECRAVAVMLLHDLLGRPFKEIEDMFNMGFNTGSALAAKARGWAATPTANFRAASAIESVRQWCMEQEPKKRH